MTSKKIAIVGFGELGKQILYMISAFYPNHECHVFDDIEYSLDKSQFTHPFSSFLDKKYSDFDFYVGLGYKHLECKKKIIQSLLANHRRLPAFIHPSSFQNISCQIEDGSIVYPMSNIDRNALIGRGALINNSVVISHDCEIGDCSYISPGCVLAGQVKVGYCVFLGAGVLVANGVTIGCGARIGIGTVVTSDVKSGSSVIGNPMRELKKPLNLL